MSRAAFIAGLLVVAAMPALAQSGPFGVGLPEQGLSAGGDGFLAEALRWIMAQQAAFYLGLKDAVRDLAAGGDAGVTLAWLSFLYGVFHAAGPGHGKAVLTSYILANEATLRRGIVLSFAAAAVQATSAVVLVSVLAILLGATSIAMTNAAWWLEVASYALVAAIGAWLLVRKTGLLAWARRAEPRAVALGAAVAGDGHAADCGCCGPMPDAARLARPLKAREALATVFAIGLRPCTGAIIVLVFALAQGLYGAGIAAAYMMGLGTALTVAAIAAIAVFGKAYAVRLLMGRGRWAARVGTGIEILGAALVFAFGMVLLAGALGAA